MVVVVNNDGYTVERAIHGRTAYYNDIVRWTLDSTSRTRSASATIWRSASRTTVELDDAFTAAAAHRDRMVFIEAVVPQLDVPPLLTELAESAAAANASQIAMVRKAES